jgi:carboxyl-terminal processing protease
MSESTAQRPCPRRHVLLAGLVTACVAAGFHGGARAQPNVRMALIIGNARYADAPLHSPLNDVRLMDETLRKIGFQTEVRTDVSLADITLAVEAWLRKAASAGVRLIYFSGHGAQYRGSSYLLPVDVKLRSEDDLPGAALHVDALIDRYSRLDSGVNVLVVDACRSVPATLSPSAGLKGDRPVKWTPGMAAVAVPQGTLVAWATSRGAMAMDNPRSGHSLFTKHLAAQLSMPGLPVEEVLKRTREAVKRESAGTQVPEDTSTLIGSFCLVPSEIGACGKP